MPNPDPLQPFILEILTSKKYRDLRLSQSTVRSLLEQELPRHRSRKAALDAVRARLHNIVAPYLGDPDYPAAIHALDDAFRTDDAAVRAVCLEILAAHSSTRERIPILERFYHALFTLTGVPQVIFDLACGLNPLAFPWMGLPSSTQYHAYDIHAPRLELINHFFTLQGLPPLAEQRDILVQPPEIEADVAFFFKEAHRFEQRQRGSTRFLLQNTRARWLLVSLPVNSLSGRHSLLDRQRALITTAVEGLPWLVTELLCETEIVFCIQKNPG